MPVGEQFKSMKTLYLMLALALSGCANMPPLTRAEAERRQQQRNENREREIEQRRQNYISLHEVNPEVAKSIREGKIAIGMTEDEVRASWGDAIENPSADANESYNQWIYSSSFVNAAKGTYLYFKNGRLESWHDVN
jgi:predicted nucleotide-binding protein (sugar kinase/HSP70/actin superfamily)